MKTTIRSIAALAMGCILTLGITASGWSQTNLVIERPEVRPDDYRTVLLSWNAETGSVFQIESADALGAEGAQGLQWVVRETGWSSMGTNSEWLDVGDTRWIPRILHPLFQPQRFYRVQKVSQATDDPPTLAVQLSQTNQVSGWLDVAVSLTYANTNQQMSSVSVFVDGQKIRTLTRESFLMSINTTEWPNGPHDIYAVATTVDSGETTGVDETVSTNTAAMGIGVSAAVTATFENYISRFFVAVPYFDPDAGQTQEIAAVFAEDSFWRVTVLDYLDQAVRQFEGQGSACYAAWDGNDQFGLPLPYGYYDYVVEARPSQYGPLPLASSRGTSSIAPLSSMNQSNAEQIDPAAEYKRTAAAMQFSRTNSGVHEGLEIPSLNPPQPVVEDFVYTWEEETLFPSSFEEALDAGLTSYFVPHPPMPPVEVNGQWFEWEELYGPVPPIEVQISDGDIEQFLLAIVDSLESSEAESQGSQWGDFVYITSTPIRFPGDLFMGHAGTVGIAFQDHHPKGGDFAVPVGGVISETAPPYGPLGSVVAIASGFSDNMSLGGWRTSFYLGNNNLRHTNIVYDANRIGKFASSCDFGFFVGHMTAAQNSSSYGATHTWLPLYNSDFSTATYTWVGLPQFDLGQLGRPDPLKWMALYGCNSLRQQDFNDMWTKFLLPMPPNLRLLLGSEHGVFIHPIFGGGFAANMHGWTTTNGVPMTIAEAWYDAARAADVETAKSLKWRHRMGTRVMTVGYRATLTGGSWNTINDSIWDYRSGVSYDWFDVSIDWNQVYP